MAGEQDVKIIYARKKLDFATIIGLIAAIGLIGAALALGGRASSFLDLRSALIVVGGTLAITIMSYSLSDMATATKVIAQTFSKQLSEHKAMAIQLLDLATYARKNGVLSLQKFDDRLKRMPFLHRTIRLVADGTSAEDIDKIIGHEIEAITARHEYSVGMLRRAAEVAPAMGLIGTLVGLVQMLASLDDPSSIGPSMAVALLTTFYGAILGTVILSPLAAKLETRAEDEFINKTLILLGAMSMARKENPRRLEMMVNTTLPPEDRVNYFRS